MIPRPLGKLLFVAVCSCGVSEEALKSCLHTGGSARSAGKSQLHTTLPALGRGDSPTPAQICVYVCPGCWASPWTEPGLTWTRNGSHWLILCLKKWGVNLLLSLTKLSLHKCLFACALHPANPFYFSMFPPLHSQCQDLCLPGDVGYLCFCFQLSLFFFFISTWEMLWPVEIEHNFSFSPLCEGVSC